MENDHTLTPVKRLLQDLYVMLMHLRSPALPFSSQNSISYMFDFIYCTKNLGTSISLKPITFCHKNKDVN